MNPKKAKNSPLRVDGVIWANRLLARAWLPPDDESYQYTQDEPLESNVDAEGLPKDASHEGRPPADGAGADD